MPAFTGKIRIFRDRSWNRRRAAGEDSARVCVCACPRVCVYENCWPSSWQPSSAEPRGSTPKTGTEDGPGDKVALQGQRPERVTRPVRKRERKGRSLRGLLRAKS